MSNPYVITVTKSTLGHPGEPTTSNLSARTGPDAHAVAKRESKEHPDAVVTMWINEQMQDTHPCGECGRENWPWGYRPRAVYHDGTRLYTFQQTLEALSE
jgi:hypothetical protein